LIPPEWKLYGSLSFRLFMTDVHPTHPSCDPSALAPSRLNGPSLSTQPIPWSLVRAGFATPRRYTSGRAAASTTMIVNDVPSLIDCMLLFESRCMTENRLLAL
jgi:hypothetical protein